jgi:two-component system LytT family response regulator
MASPLKAFVVDDERLARRELRSMLAAMKDVEVVGEAATVEEALAGILTSRPDALLLDIHLCGEAGFDLLDRLADRPATIFITAYDAFAIRAFEVNALDYLLKPVTAERLAASLERVRQGQAAGSDGGVRFEYGDRIWAESKNQARLVPLCEVVCIRAAGDYSEVTTTDGRTSLVLRSLKDWEDRLPVSHFLRVHRSAIVNLAHVERLEPRANHTFLVYLAEGEVVEGSRRYFARIRDRFSR